MPAVQIDELETKQTKLRIYFPLTRKIRGVRQGFRKKFGIRYPLKSYVISDWKEKWKENFHARKVTPRLWICPSWERVKTRKNERVIYLDPGMAFGTGLHPTTRFVLKMIDRYPNRIHSLLDVGTGSGVLAIAASLLGIPQIQAVEFDPEAVKVARQNFKKNKCRNIRLQPIPFEKLRPNNKFDFIAANLETDLLIKNKKKLISLLNPKGHLTATGVATQSYGLVCNAYQKAGLRLITDFRAQSWSGFCFQQP